MKNNLFIISQDYEKAKAVSKKVAEFFSMRLLDSIEMFEFDNSPRKIGEVVSDFGRDYTKKEMRSIARMQLDFDDALFVGNYDYLDAYNELSDKINQKNLVVFLNDNNGVSQQGENSLCEKLKFLADCCDVAIDISCLPNEEIFDKVIVEIKNFYGIED